MYPPNKYQNLKQYSFICLINLLIAAGMGLLLRYAFIGIPFFNFKHLVHAHSHTAALGWGYLLISVFILNSFLSSAERTGKRLFLVTQLAVLGMAFSFPFQGYGPVSVPFSVLHIICSYVFVYLVWRYADFQNAWEKLALRGAVIFLVLSTIGIWCLGPSIVLYGKNSSAYSLCIQFYLHFLFHGFFIFSMLGLFLRSAGSSLDKIRNNKNVRVAGLILLAAVPLSFTTIINQFFPYIGFQSVNVVTQILQLISVTFLGILFGKVSIPVAKSIHFPVRWLFRFAWASLLLKFALQACTVFPEIARYSFLVRIITLGFIHLILLGFLTSFLLGLMIILFCKTACPRTIRWGSVIYLIGVILTEAAMFLQGLSYLLEKGNIPSINEWMFMFSILLVVGLLLYIAGFLYSKKFG